MSTEFHLPKIVIYNFIICLLKYSYYTHTKQQRKNTKRNITGGSEVFNNV